VLSPRFAVFRQLSRSGHETMVARNCFEKSVLRFNRIGSGRSFSGS
jgi:hypothetical protein